MNADEQRARELLAAAYRDADQHEDAYAVANGVNAEGAYGPELAAIIAALARQVPEAGEVRVFNCRRCPVSVTSRWIEPECPECGDPCELDASAKATPQAPQPVVDGMEMIESVWLDRLTRFIGPGAMAYLSRLHSDAAALAAHGKPNS